MQVWYENRKGLYYQTFHTSISEAEKLWKLGGGKIVGDEYIITSSSTTKSHIFTAQILVFLICKLKVMSTMSISRFLWGSTWMLKYILLGPKEFKSNSW